MRNARGSVRVLYGPTLGSGGAYAALPSHFAAADFDVAVVSSRKRFAKTYPNFSGPVMEVDGHWQGLQALRRIRSQHGNASVLAAQNPCFWPFRWRATTLVQNTKFMRPKIAWRFAASTRERFKIFLSTVLTEIQVLRSEEVISLAPDVPERWKSISKVLIRPNQLGRAVLDRYRSPQADRLVLYVGTTEPFRHPHLAVSAFDASGLASDGWRLRVYAMGPPAARTRLQAHIDTVDQACLAELTENPVDELVRCSIAIFPSAMEGSSFSFLEALHLARVVIASDEVFFKQEAPEIPSEARRLFVHDFSVEAWSEALRRAAASPEAGVG